MNARWLLGLSLALPACSYPEFAFTPGDTRDSEVVVETSGEDTIVAPQDSDAIDSASDATINATIDATTDGSIDSKLDSAAPDTAVADTKPDAPADTAGPRGCDLPHDFCADFDTVMMPDDDWTSSFSASTGALMLDGTNFRSPTRSLVATVGPSSTTASAMLVKSFTVAASTTAITAEGDLFLDSLTYAHANEIILFKVQRSTAGDGVFLTVGASGVSLFAQGTTTNRWPVTGVVAGKWFHVKMEAVLHTTSGSAKLWIDGALVQNRTGVTTAEINDTTRQLLVGVFAYLGAVPFKARFDDVSYDLP